MRFDHLGVGAGTRWVERMTVMRKSHPAVGRFAGWTKRTSRRSTRVASARRSERAVRAAAYG
jgi:hypothetical protein